MTGSDLDDDRLGLPVARMPRTVAAPPPPTIEPELRPGETELGRPPQVPRILAPVTDADRRQLADADRAAENLALQEAEEELAAEPSLGWLGFLSHPVAVAFLIGSAAVLGLFVYSQAMSVVASLGNVVEPFRTIGYAGLVLLGICVLYAGLRLAGFYYGLRRNRQVRLASLKELSDRTRMRWLVHAKAADAKTRLEDYLRRYPLGTKTEEKRLAAVGLTSECQTELRSAREKLLDSATFSTTDDWFRQFRDTFQSRLDVAAAERISYWAKRAGVVNATAPNGLIDALAGTFFGFAMINDLCRVYNLRAGRTGTAVLLSRVFFNAYLTGQMTDLEKLTEDQLNSLTGPNGPLGELVAARVASKLGTKAAGGLLAYFLLVRLGKYACRLLRPMGAD